VTSIVLSGPTIDHAAYPNIRRPPIGILLSLTCVPGSHETILDDSVAAVASSTGRPTDDCPPAGPEPGTALKGAILLSR